MLLVMHVIQVILINQEAPKRFEVELDVRNQFKDTIEKQKHRIEVVNRVKDIYVYVVTCIISYSIHNLISIYSYCTFHCFVVPCN